MFDRKIIELNERFSTIFNSCVTNQAQAAESSVKKAGTGAMVRMWLVSTRK